MIHPAICEIDKCGVLAIGRCATCNCAFCHSHQAYELFHVGYLPNMCSTCFAKTPEEVARMRREAHNQKLVKAREYFVSGTAKKELIKNDVPFVNLYSIETNVKSEKTGLFGRGEKWVAHEEVTKIGSCWYIGDFRWKVNGYSVNDSLSGPINEDGILPIALSNLGDGEVIRVIIFKDGYRIPSKYENGLRDRSESLEWEEWINIEKAVKRMAKKGQF